MGGKRIDLTGQKFNRLFVQELDIEKTSKSSKRKSYWICLCDCGNITSVDTYSLKSEHTKSCGCYQKEVIAKISEQCITHNSCSSREYRIWTGIKSRCTNPNRKSYKNYGERGIVCCPEWLESFENFYRDMGACPEGYTIERLDNLRGGYNPQNCKWASQTEQQNNRRNNVLIEFNGKKQTVPQWAREIGLTQGALTSRLRQGWDVARALTTPPRQPKTKQ